MGDTKYHGNGNKTPRIDETVQAACGQEAPPWGEGPPLTLQTKLDFREAVSTARFFFCPLPHLLIEGDLLIQFAQDRPDFKTASPMSQEPTQSWANQNYWSPFASLGFKGLVGVCLL